MNAIADVNDGHSCTTETHQDLFFVQIVAASIAAVVIPIMLVVLQEPTRDHVMLAIVIPIICVMGVMLGIKSLRKMEKEFCPGANHYGQEP